MGAVMCIGLFSSNMIRCMVFHGNGGEWTQWSIVMYNSDVIYFASIVVHINIQVE